MINQRQETDPATLRLGFTKSVSLMDSEAQDTQMVIKSLARPTIHSGSMRGLRYVESAVAGQSPEILPSQKLALASTLVDQVTLPAFLISLDQFQTLNLPPMNNFRV